MELAFRNLVFWGIWLIIPLIVDIIYGLISAALVLKDYFTKKNNLLEYYPNVTILVPVLNSEKTLYNCLDSIASQNYPIDKIQVLLIDNGSTDNSNEIFYTFQSNNPNLRIWWIASSKGKAKALNKGLYAADGKYIINIDSDGILDKNAVLSIVQSFEENNDIFALTGVVLIDPAYIKNIKSKLLRFLQNCELFEYSEAFLIGRGGQSITNSMFTLAGAFSCFRKEVILRTQLYNNETLGEDTHMTSQIREFFEGKIALCERAFFFVDPVESLDKLYIQRQRWQRGQIEVSSLFSGDKGLNIILKFNIIMDHTLVFPRLIWMFAMFYLVFIDYPLQLVINANILMYFLYFFNSIVYFMVSQLFLKDLKDISHYMIKHCYIIIFLPFFRIILFFMRVAGIINSYERYAKWNTKTLSQEINIIKKSLMQRLKYYYKLRGWMNNE